MGFCCIYAIIRAVRGRSSPQVAKRLGLHPRAIQYWRYKVRDGEVKCNKVKCGCAMVEFEGEIPRVDLSRLREGTKYPFV